MMETRKHPVGEGDSSGLPKAPTTGFDIRRATSRDIQRIVQLTDNEFGAGYFIRRYQSTLHDDPLIDTFVAEIKDRVEGFISVITVDKARLRDEFGISTEVDGPHGVLKIAAVDATRQRRGLGSGLMCAAVLALEARGVSALWGSAWINPSTGMASDKMLEQVGLVQVEKVPNFWMKESLEFPSWPCSECTGSCKCAAMIYFRSA